MESKQGLARKMRHGGHITEWLGVSTVQHSTHGPRDKAHAPQGQRGGTDVYHR